MKRHAAIRDLQSHLNAHQFPRLQMMTILAICGMTAFLSSAVLLVAGIRSMAFRYGIAGVAGYLAFMVLIRMWIAWQREPADALDVLDPEVLVDTVQVIDGSGLGGPSGVSDVRIPAHVGPRALQADTGTWRGGKLSLDLDLDLDEAWWLVVTLAAALAGITAIAYVVYLAPALLAEVALDAALLSGVYRRLRKYESGHWSHAVIRRTWVPALVLIVSLVAAGYALQQAFPSARSIGGVVRALTE